ncbi:hypothetical protein [Salirhabdus salicampi]|uniref:hypothetical protein n=1 Tax=Salirhabdus salicampi TaxID=476102 RepID=UPI0020C3E069|nr:hypothetical protein [Salirhabdus salicampi]MCP8616002.1 hypothetical protein [Salirhabdus salicampi]
MNCTFREIFQDAELYQHSLNKLEPIPTLPVEKKKYDLAFILYNKQLQPFENITHHNENQFAGTKLLQLKHFDQKNNCVVLVPFPSHRSYSPVIIPLTSVCAVQCFLIEKKLVDRIKQIPRTKAASINPSPTKVSLLTRAFTRLLTSSWFPKGKVRKKRKQKHYKDVEKISESLDKPQLANNEPLGHIPSSENKKEMSQPREIKDDHKEIHTEESFQKDKMDVSIGKEMSQPKEIKDGHEDIHLEESSQEDAMDCVTIEKEMTYRIIPIDSIKAIEYYIEDD